MKRSDQSVIDTEDFRWLLEGWKREAVLSESTKKNLRRRRDEANRVAALIDKQRRKYLQTDPKIWSFNEYAHMSDFLPLPASDDRTSKAMEDLAKMLREESAAIGAYLKSYGRVDQRRGNHNLNLDFIVAYVLRNANFHAWPALADLLTDDAEDIDSLVRELRRKAAQVRKLKGASHGAPGKNNRSPD